MNGYSAVLCVVCSLCKITKLTYIFTCRYIIEIIDTEYSDSEAKTMTNIWARSGVDPINVRCTASDQPSLSVHSLCVVHSGTTRALIFNNVYSRYETKLLKMIV